MLRCDRLVVAGLHLVSHSAGHCVRGSCVGHGKVCCVDASKFGALDVCVGEGGVLVEVRGCYIRRCVVS